MVTSSGAAERESSTSTEAVERLDEYVISDTRLPEPGAHAASVPTKISVVDSEDIIRSGARTVQEAIANMTGIVMYDGVGNAFEQTIDMRGFNGKPVSATSVFVDGVRVNDPEFGFVNFDLIPLQAVEQIELAPGAASIFGKNAMGGVVNIVTKRGAPGVHVSPSAAWGSFGRERYTGTISGGVDLVDAYAHVTREREDGFRDDAEASVWRVFGKVGVHPWEGTDANVSYTYVENRLHQAGSLPISIADLRPETNLTPGDVVDRGEHFVRATLRQHLPAGITGTVNGFYRRVESDLFLVSQPVFVGGNNSTSRNRADVDSWGGTAQLIHEAELLGVRNELLVGGELVRNDFRNRLQAQSDFGPFQVRRTSEEQIAAAFVQDTIHLTEDLSVMGGVRFDRNELTFRDRLNPANNGRQVFDRFTPRAGMTYVVAPSFKVYGSYAQGFRVPTNDELFAQGLFGSNPNLTPAKSETFEIGMNAPLGAWGKVEAAVYHTTVRDEIFFTCIACDFSAGDGQNRNINKTRRRGIEATLTVKPNAYVDGAVNYTYTEAQFRSRIALAADRHVDVGDSFPLVPKHRLNATATVHPIDGLNVSLIGQYVSTQFLESDEDNDDERLPGYVVMNGRLSYTHPVPRGSVTAFLHLNNLLNRRYYTSGIFAANRVTGGGATERFVVPAPGIAVFAGLTYRADGLTN